MGKAGYVGNQPVRESQEESYPGAWTGQEQLQEIKADRWPPSVHEVERSVRINSVDNAYFSRTPSSSGNRRTWTWSGWIKRSALASGNKTVFMATTDGYVNHYTRFIFTTDNIYINHSSGSGGARQSSAKYRDTAAWMHVVIALDTTQAVGADRLKFYVNGQQVTAYSGGDPGLNDEWWVNSSSAVHYIGTAAGSEGFDGYLANVHLIDGLALTPSAFGTIDPGTSQWVPKKYTNSYGYGANGFWLKFAGNSSSSALGTDSSGNGNTWTVDNINGPLVPSGYTADYAISGTAPTYTPYGTSFGWQTAFDGTLSTGPITYITGYSELDVQNKPSWSSTIRVYIVAYYAGDVAINGVALGVNSSGWKDVTSLVGSSGTLNTVRISSVDSNYVRLGAIELDGVILNDGGSVFSRSEIDSLVDTPTSYGTDTGAGGEVRGNYCTWNPLRDNRSGYNEAPRNGNLDTNPRGDFVGTLSLKSGKYYWEIFIQTVTTSGQAYIGAVDYSQVSESGSRGWSTSQIAAMRDTGSFYGNGSTGTAVSYGQGDVLGFALDVDAGKLWIAKNGTWVNSGNPAAGTGHAFSGLTFNSYTPIASDSSTGQIYVLNAGQRAWSYTAPSGFKALCDTNLPTPTIAKGSTAMDVKLYTGNGSTQTISGLGFSPDFVWTKARNTNYSHQLIDIIRGGTRPMFSDRTDAEGTYQSITAFNSDGYTVSTELGVNGSGTPFAAWCWDAGSSTVTNTQGSISSQVRANASAGFSVVTFTSPTGTGNFSAGHGLGVTPEFVIVKSRDAAGVWYVYHKSLATDHYLRLNGTNASATDGVQWGAGMTSSVLGLRASYSTVSGATTVAYAFAPVAGYSAMGSYVGNGSSDGTFVFTGFRPKFLLCKRSDGISDWGIYDSSRAPYNAVQATLYADLPNAEGSGTDRVDFLSNGFKWRVSGSSEFNGSGWNVVYLAFAESPFAYSRAR